MADPLEVALDQLKRQREEIDRRIAELQNGRSETTEILDRLQKWRERADDTTRRITKR